MKTPSLLLCVALLAGCATAPSQTKPPLPDNQYGATAAFFTALHKCGLVGKVLAADVAFGKQMIASRAADYAVDMPRMKQAIENYGAQEPEDKHCNQAAMMVADGRLKSDNAKVSRPVVVQESPVTIKWPTQTYCNKIGNQVLCSTY